MPTPPVLIDWMVVATIAAPLLALVAGIWLKNVFENRPQLVTFFGAVSVFNYTAPNGTRLVVHTHDVVVRNTGRRSAHNVRLGHQTLPDHNISPAVDHRVIDVPGGGKEIILPTLVPGEQIVVSYLYFPPITYAQVNTYVKSDEGLATVITVLLEPQAPKWLSVTGAWLMLLGLVTAIYLLWIGIRAVVGG